MIEAKNIKKDYYIKSGKFFDRKKSVKEAVKNVNIKIEKGSIVGLLGINGAGKTTTIKMLTTMISPTSGTIEMDGLDIVKNHLEAKKRINIITGGERNLYWRLTGQENLEYFGALYGINKCELDKKIGEILKIVDLYDAKDIPVEKYSKGMKQRLQIARGLINNPEYLFLDEPTLGLDVMIAKSVHNYIKKLAQEEKKGILITTHYIHEAELLCDYVYVINEGIIVAEGTPEEIKNLYTDKKTYQVIIEPAEKELVETFCNVKLDKCDVSYDEESLKLNIKTADLNITEINKLFVDSDIDVNNIECKPISLEDALVEIIEGGKNNVMCN